MILNLFDILPSSQAKFTAVFLFLLLSCNSLFSQDEINFGEFSSRYSITTTLINSELEFGNILQSQGTKEADIDEAAVIEIEGIKYLDIILDIAIDSPMQIDGCSQQSCTMQFTLKASYSNSGETSEISALNKTKFIGQRTVDFTNKTGLLTTQFPILERGSAPPGPPPTPDFKGRNLEAEKESVFIFLYGSITASNNDVGSYASNITVSINYD
ncbi:MAG: hypothetical protein CL666_05865 [Balneola sp.]|nr:hypothetical protein [Balneola sp.]|tara:strand:+ start:150208 stop:150849 length:642 start_codon:yes stop_codon:yes gene_type:complete